jgi:hypothetical protein
MKYVEIIYDEADAAMQNFVREAVGGTANGDLFFGLSKFDMPCGHAPSDNRAIGFTDPTTNTRYRVYLSCKSYNDKEYREVCRTMDRSKGAVLEVEN